ncbi:MAG: GDP-mannose 4,6-dehydratase [bacterium]|nr:GDP-mannose 4,6-dehydratase [bacterium]
MTDQHVAIVTGGAGFIGSHLCEALLKAGKRVVCIDNFSTGNVRNIEALVRNPNFQFLRLDITNDFDLENIPELNSFKIPFTGVQEIYHLAVPTSIKSFEKHRIATLRTSTLGTANLLACAAKYNARFLYASSSVVYGPRRDDRPNFNEADYGVLDHLQSRAIYDEGKRYGETMVRTYAEVKQLPVRIARIFRTYGPRMPLFDGHQVPDFILQALEGEDVVVNGGADFTTSLVYVSDICDGLLKLMASDIDMPVNLGSDINVPLMDVAKTIVEMVGSNSNILEGERMPFLSELGIPDIQKAKSELDWLPLTTLENGLKRTIEYIRANKILLAGD